MPRIGRPSRAAMRGQHPGRVADADHQRPAPGAQLGVEGSQALAQEREPGRCAMVPAPEEHRVGDPQAHHRPAGGGAGEGGVVGDAQVAPEPDDGGGSGHRCQSAGPGAGRNSPTALWPRASVPRVTAICGHLRPVTPDEHIAPWPFALVSQVRDPLQEFLATESAGGIVLAAAARDRDPLGDARQRLIRGVLGAPHPLVGSAVRSPT